MAQYNRGLGNPSLHLPAATYSSMRAGPWKTLPNDEVGRRSGGIWGCSLMTIMSL
ncbi:hypothetical protein EMPG_13101 [Blastomyces silverae]|uniref:Uncharacterized protein n=1 Tax=Blastomyces silverae TaxID=2060906 RepID=A0A0H1BK59_9EURO|nr:hypothetical protein EMPG_13101 [Blastomyces silverae]